MTHADTLELALRLLARSRRVLDYMADEIQQGRPLNLAAAGIAQDLASEIVALVGHSITDQPESPEMFALREFLDEVAEGDEPDPFAPGTRVQVHELDGGYLVFRMDEP